MAPRNLYLEYIGQGEDDTPAAQARIQNSYGINPEQAARINALAQRVGVPPVVAKEQEEILTRRVRQEDATAALYEAPATRGWIAQDQTNADLVSDHIPSAATLEKQIRKTFQIAEPPKPPPTVLNIGRGLWNDFRQSDLAAEAGLREMIANFIGNRSEAARQRERGIQHRAEAERTRPEFETKVGGMVYGGASSFLQTLPAVAAGVATRNPSVTLGIIGAQTQGQAYSKYTGRGATPSEALLGATGETAVEVITETAPMGFLVKKFGKAGFRSFLSQYLIKEMATEQVATFLQDAIDTAVANPDKTWGDFWAERGEAALGTAIGTLMSTGAYSGANYLATRAGRRLAQADQAAEQAPLTAEQFNAAAQAVAESPLRERAPERFKALIDNMAINNDVYVPASVLSAYLQTATPEETAALVSQTGIQDQLAAATPEASIVIKASDYLTYIAPTPAHQALQNDVRIGPAGMSINEAQEHSETRQQQLNEAAGRVLAAEAQEVAQSAPRARVEQHLIESQIQAGVPEAQARAFAAVQAQYFETRAQGNARFADAWAAYEDANPSIKGRKGVGVGPRGLPGQQNPATFNQSGELPNGDHPDRIGQRLPTAKKATDDPADPGLMVDVEASERTPEAFSRNVGLVVNYPGVRIPPEATTPTAQARAFIELAKRNLRWLYDRVDPAQRQRAKLWYDGARAITDRWSDRYELPDRAIAGVLASLSPQKDWYQNVSLAERVLDIVSFDSHHAWTAEMQETADRIFPAENYPERTAFTDKTLAEVQNPIAAGMWVRVFDETYNDSAYRVVSPEGEFLDWQTKNNGERRRVTWGSSVEIGKAVSVIRDPSRENINLRMGGKHKVRNFYNNILAPRAPHGDVTIDTHAVAAALMRPLSGTNVEVAHNFGSYPGRGQPSAAASSQTGIQGTYALYAEAYRELAEEIGLKPRELQSITWEAVRGLFTDQFKGKSKNKVAQADDIWREVQDGTITEDQARERIEELVGGIADPSWVGSYARLHEGGRDRSYEGKLLASRLSDGTARPLDSGVGGGTAAGAAGLGPVRSFNQGPARGVRRGVAVPVVEDDGTIVLSHWSNKGRISQLDPEMWGENWEVLPDDEKARVGDAPGRTYWGIGRGRSGEYQPEYGIGGFRYETQVPFDRLYDIDADPDGLRAQAEREAREAEDGDDPDPNDVTARFETLIRDAGYMGYRSRNPEIGAVVALYEKVPHKARGRYTAPPADTASIQDFTRENLSDLLERTGWTIMTAENPAARTGDEAFSKPADNAKFNKALEKELRKRGLDFYRVEGRYDPEGPTEHSYIVTGISEADALALGQQFGQESVLTRRGFLYADGTYQPATGVTVHEEAPENFYTRVPATGAVFTVDIDFDTRLPLPSTFGGALEGLPRRIKVDGQTRVFGPYQPARNAAQAYMERAGLPYSPPTTYAPVDEDRARRIAEAYEAMEHNPQDPEVAAAYEAMIAETLAQYQEIKRTGLKIEFNPEGQDPYGNPRNAILDVVENNHLYVFPTDEGFGSSDMDVSDNPLLRVVPGEKWGGKPVRVNDVFRLVHDYFGHIKEGVGFRADGEENAWRMHSAMYSPLARRAMTTETRGQNSWVNYGPHGERNRTASGGETVFADQKIGLLPEWVTTEGATDTSLQQGAKGSATFTDQGAIINLFKSADFSTLIHEGGHLWLENLARDANDENATQAVRDDWLKVRQWWAQNVEQATKEITDDTVKARIAADPTYMTQIAMTFGESEADPAVRLEAVRPFHEMFARGAERYFLEGKVPNTRLQSVMRRIRNWLTAIYRDVSRLNVPMTDDVRGVFDRLIGVDMAIADATQDQGFQPFFSDPQQAGMTQAEFDAYIRAIRDADETASNRLLGRVMNDIRRRYTKAWKAERESLIEDLGEVINATPEMQALTLLETGEVKLARADVGDESLLYRRFKPYVADEGLHPDVIAEQVGMRSGAELIAALQEMKREHDELRANDDTRTVRQARIEAAADAEMIRRHGDILNDGTIGEEAQAAVHDMRRSEIMMGEVRALIRKAGANTTIWTEAEMERWARDKIGALSMSQVRPHVYQAAEAKAGRDALKALVADDFQTALDAKFRQLLNMQLYKAAKAAREDYEKGKDLFHRIATAKNGTLAKSRNMDMVEAARAILAPYGYSSTRNDADYMAKIQRYDPELWADIEPVVIAATAGAKPVEDLTQDEFNSLHTVVRQLWEMSRNDRVIQVGLDKLGVDDVAEELAVVVESKGPLTSTEPTGNATPRQQAARILQGFRAHMRRVESWVQRMDGGWDGPFRRYIWNPVSSAADTYRTQRLRYQEDLRQLLEPMRDSLKPGKIVARELGPNGHVFGNGNNGVGKSELLHALLHLGNSSNRRKLLLGRQWATERADGSLDTTAWDSFLARMHNEGAITERDWQFVQDIWDLLERTKPDAQRAHRQVFGRYFEEITAEPVNTPWGQLRGGYVPALTDNFFVQEQALNAAAEAVTDSNSANMFPQPNRGFTKSRVEYNKPLALDLTLLPQHLDKVLKFTYMTAPVRDVLRLLKTKRLSTPLEAYDPVAVPSMLLPWLNRAARQIIETQAADSAGKGANAVLRAVRARAGMGIMMANLSNTIQQLTGWFPAALRVEKRHMARALWQYSQGPRDMVDAITTMSPYMAVRMSGQVMDTMNDIDTLLLNPSRIQRFTSFSQRHAYIMQTIAQNMVDAVTWSGAFEQAIEQGQDYADAVRYADSTIRETQGSLNPEDVSAWETGSPLKRLFTQFFSYFSAQGNLLTTEFSNAKTLSRAGYIYVMGILMPAVGAEIIRRSVGGGWDDEDDDGYLDTFLDVFFGSQARYATGMLPVVGQVVTVAINQFDGQRFNDDLVPSPVFSQVQSAAEAPHSVWRAVAEGKGQKGAVRDTATLLTMLTGVPLFNAAARPLGYLADVNEGKVEPQNPVDLARGLATGTPSEASRTQ